jgi:hypothetical protein
MPATEQPLQIGITICAISLLIYSVSPTIFHLCYLHFSALLSHFTSVLFCFCYKALNKWHTFVFTMLLNKSAINGFYWTLSSFLLRRNSSIRINSVHFYEIRQRQDPSRRFIESEIYIPSKTFLDVSPLFVMPDSCAWNISLLFILYKNDETCVFYV